LRLLPLSPRQKKHPSFRWRQLPRGCRPTRSSPTAEDLFTQQPDLATRRMYLLHLWSLSTRSKQVLL
jgi:hypothetical protein